MRSTSPRRTRLSAYHKDPRGIGAAIVGCAIFWAILIYLAV
jgi:hypothetical protein